MPDNYQSLFAGGTTAWHSGNSQLTYNFISTSLPSYYDYDPFENAYDIGGEIVPTYNSFNMTAAEQAMMQQAVDAWNEVANINMVQSGGQNANMQFGATDFDDEYLFGFAWYPAPYELGVYTSVSGDVWINQNNDYQSVPGIGPMYGHTSWNTFLHELGHALGLSHPNDDPEDVDTNTQFTVMSYIEHPSQSHLLLEEQAWPLTPMVWDMQAIQELYGANTTTRTTDTVYLGDGNGTNGAQTYQYAANDMQITGADGTDRDVILTIWDAGGTDLIDASELETDSTIDLRPGEYSSIGGIDDNIAVAAAVEENGAVINYIENAWGGAGDDLITGNDGRNTLRGYGGSDTISGGSGRDFLNGGSGRDTLDGNGGRDVLTGGGRGDRLKGGGGNDMLRGSGGRDLLNGGSGRDTLDGGAGSDRLIGKGGHDVFVFGTGADKIADFNTQSDREVIDLSRSTAITDFTDLLDNHMSDTAEGALISDGSGNSMLLIGIDSSLLAANDFLF